MAWIILCFLDNQTLKQNKKWIVYGGAAFSFGKIYLTKS
jgi:hypothetical protein